MRGKIFISYRRDDARADARSIYQRLQRSFGSNQLFMDVDSIPRGTDFRELLDRYLIPGSKLIDSCGLSAIPH